MSRVYRVIPLPSNSNPHSNQCCAGSPEIFGKTYQPGLETTTNFYSGPNQPIRLVSAALSNRLIGTAEECAHKRNLSVQGGESPIFKQYWLVSIAVEALLQRCPDARETPDDAVERLVSRGPDTRSTYSRCRHHLHNSRTRLLVHGVDYHRGLMGHELPVRISPVVYPRQNQLSFRSHVRF